MMPIMRREIEVLLDSPDSRDYVVSAYADLSLQGGFERHVERELENRAKAAEAAMADMIDSVGASGPLSCVVTETVAASLCRIKTLSHTTIQG